jgi:glycerol-3-phosphate dehydrogenase
LRAATEHGDYQIHVHADQRYVCVGGIRSTGLSASMGIAEYVVEQLQAIGLALTPKAEFKSIHMPNIGEAFPRPYQQQALIASNSRYGEIVCFCERVTRGEIDSALNSVIPAQDLDGLRRRTRAHLGRCQGFFCSAEILSIIAENAQIPIDALIGLGESSS